MNECLLLLLFFVVLVDCFLLASHTIAEIAEISTPGIYNLGDQ